MANIIKTLKTSLKGVLGSDATALTVRKFVDSKGRILEYSDFGGEFVVVVEQGDKIEMILCDNITQNADGSATLNIKERHVDPKPPYNGGSSGLRFTTGAQVIVSNDPLTLKNFANSKNDNDFTGENTFAKFPKKVGVLTPTSGDEFTTKDYVDSLAMGGTLSVDRQSISGTAGENITQGNIVYYKEADNKWYLANANDTAKSSKVRLGVAQNTVLPDNDFNILLSGLDKTQTGLSAGSKVYLGTTNGHVTMSPSGKKVFLGWALSDSNLLFSHVPDFDKLNYDEKQALNTDYALSENNKVIDEGSVSNGASYSGTTISFDSSNSTINDSANGFVTAGFRRGQEITVSGSNDNDGTYRIKSVTASAITVTGALTDESAGASVSITSATANKVAMYDGSGKLPLSLSKKFIAKEDLVTLQPVDLMDDSGVVKAISGETTYDNNIISNELKSGALGTYTDYANYIHQVKDYQYIKVYGINSNNCNMSLITYNEAGDDFTVHEFYQNLVFGADVAVLDETHFAVIYRNGNNIYAQIATINSPTSVSFGSAVLIGNGAYNNSDSGIHATKINNNTVLVAFTRDSSNYLNLVVFTYSGTTVTANLSSQIQYSAYANSVIVYGQFQIKSHRQNAALLAWGQDSSYVRYSIIQWNGSNINAGSNVTLGNSTAYYIDRDGNYRKWLELDTLGDDIIYLTYIRRYSSNMYPPILWRLENTSGTTTSSRIIARLNGSVNNGSNTRFNSYLTILSKNSVAFGKYYSDSTYGAAAWGAIADTSKTDKEYEKIKLSSTSSYFRTTDFTRIKNNVLLVAMGGSSNSFYEIEVEEKAKALGLALSNITTGGELPIAMVIGGEYGVSDTTLSVGKQYKMDNISHNLFEVQSGGDFIATATNKIIKLK